MYMHLLCPSRHREEELPLPQAVMKCGGEQNRVFPVEWDKKSQYGHCLKTEQENPEK